MIFRRYRLLAGLSVLASLATAGTAFGQTSRPRTVESGKPADPPRESKCAVLIEQAVARSKAGDTQGAERLLLDASTQCPESPAAWRELAGLRFVNSQWEEARLLAAKAVKLAPEDRHAWKILGATHFLQGNALEALRAWNRAGEPRIEAIGVSGAARTHQPVIVDRLGVAPRDLLTPSAFRRAARRAADLPSMTDAVVRYVPRDNSEASLEVDVTEGKLYPWGYASWGNILGRALLLREVKLPFAGFTGIGERLDVEYGWKRNRPRWALRVTAPAPGLLPGLLVVEFARSRQTFSAEGPFGPGRLVEDRDGVRVGLEDWATGRLHWHADGRYQRIEQARFVAIGGGIDSHFWDDHVALLVDASAWSSTGAGPGFRLASFTAKWRQRAAPGAGGFSAEAGTTVASADTPLSLWSGADVGSSREAYLRAHKLLTDGVVTSAVFGRRLTFASATYEQPIRSFKFGTATAAAFLDTARAWEGMVPGRRASQTDVGLGLRFHSPKFGSVRVDFGYGLRDGATAVSAAFVRPWPRR
ncbi:MAG TPA: hypothetical protein VN700_20595 [Vicinamibacterales bacterium]|nr:hypothetical protein [Vicinamibacterales bacterium]